MAFFQMNYHSDAVGMGVTVNVVLPESAKTLIGMTANGADGAYKTLYLLHGLSDDHSIWERRTSIERYAADRGIAVVMPTVGRSWYTDTAYGPKYLTFVAEELPSVCRGFFRGMSDKREDNFVAGLSMGGYGAVKAALTYPAAFGAFASLSGALDIAHRNGPLSEEWKGIFGYGLRDHSELIDTKHNLFRLAADFAKTGYSFPKAYLWCGTEDHLIGDNRRFRDHLASLGYAFTYEESEGNHSWKWWDLHVQDALRIFTGA